MQPPPRKRIQPLRALAAIRSLTANPEDTAQFALALEHLEGDAPRRLYRRLMRSERGRALLQNPPDLVARLTDHDALRALPEGTLGRAYLSFCEREQKSSKGLAQVIEEGRARAYDRPAAMPRHFVTEWMRDTHDLYHLVTGYRTDLIGEMCVLLFTASQTGNLAIVAPILYGAPLLGRIRPDAIGMGVRAVQRGLRARFFAEQNWEELLARPLDEVRTTLRVSPLEPYQTLHFSDVVPTPRADDPARRSAA